MRIDPSQLSEPLAHVLGVSRTDAAAGQQAASIEHLPVEEQFERLDQALLRRMRAAAVADAANSLTAVFEARAAAANTASAISGNPDAARSAAGTLDADRVRGLLGD